MQGSLALPDSSPETSTGPSRCSVVGSIKPDTGVCALQRSQPEFREPMWQYVNRRVSDWRIITGKERAIQHAALIERIEKRYGVDRYLMLALWGMESAFGERLRRSHGASRAGAPIGSESSSTRSWRHPLGVAAFLRLP